MSFRLTMYVVRTVPRESVAHLFRLLAPEALPLQISGHRFERKPIQIGLAESADITIISPPYQDNAVWPVWHAIASLLSCKWIRVSVHEGTHWDYSLYSRANHIHTFSTFPQYFGASKSEARAYLPKPSEFARIWGINESNIAPYLRNWGEGLFGLRKRVTLRGKAFPHDQYEYGNAYQYLDFLRALGSPALDDSATWQTISVQLIEQVYEKRIEGSSGKT